MANTQVKDMTELVAPAATDVLYVQADPGGTALDRKVLWSTFGNVTKVGTPVNDQLGVWTGDGTIEGDANLTWDGTDLLVTGNVGVNESGPEFPFHVTGTTAGTAAVAYQRTSSDPYGPYHYYIKRRAADAATTDGDASGGPVWTLRTGGTDKLYAGIWGVVESQGSSQGGISLMTSQSGSLGSGNEAVRIRGTGKVGINESVPLAMLQIKDRATTDDTLYLEGLAAKTGSYIKAVDSAAATVFEVDEIGNTTISGPTSPFMTVNDSNSFSKATISANGANAYYYNNYSQGVTNIGAGGWSTHWNMTKTGAITHVPILAFASSSGTDTTHSITPTYNQTGTAGSTDLLINRTETALGSGTHLLFDAQVGGTSLASIDNAGNVSTEGDIKAADGGTVTQITSITTGVTLNTHSGQITTVSAALVAGADATFTVTNSAVAAVDAVIVNTGSYAGTADGIPICNCESVAAGSFDINIRNTGAVALDAVIVINFVVIGGSAT